jgi:hypothetical protein
MINKKLNLNNYFKLKQITIMNNYKQYTLTQLIAICKENKIKGYSSKNKDAIINLIVNCEESGIVTSETVINNKTNNVKKSKPIIDMTDNYTPDILKTRVMLYKTSYVTTQQIIDTTGLPIRHQNPPEDVTENIVKFIIQNHDNEPSCKWAKCVEKPGDLWSENGSIEIKAFTSGGPSSFGPTKIFDKIYFLDMRNWVDNVFILWKINITNESTEWKQLKMNKTQMFEQQCNEKRRPHIGWDKIYSQIPQLCNKVYEGTFENIFIQPVA